VLAGAVMRQLSPADGNAAAQGAHAGGFVISRLDPQSTAGERLHWLTSEMHSARGLVALPVAGPRRRSLLGRGRGYDGIDISDPHGPDRVRHHPQLLSDAVETWARAAESALRPPLERRG
jgi:hypothetical protein